VIQKLPLPQSRALSLPWKCSDGNTGQDDRTSRRVAPLMSGRLERLLPTTFLTRCKRQEGFSANLQGLVKTRSAVLKKEVWERIQIISHFHCIYATSVVSYTQDIWEKDDTATDLRLRLLWKKCGNSVPTPSHPIIPWASPDLDWKSRSTSTEADVLASSH